MSTVARAIGVSRPHLSSSQGQELAPRKRSDKALDEVALVRIQKLLEMRPSYGYRRVASRLPHVDGGPALNHKKAYRLMKEHGLLLPKHTGTHGRVHDGKVITMKSDLRWCSDSFEIRCWSGERVYVAFALDCCDREVIGFVASTAHLEGADIRDLMALSVEARFGPGATRVPHPIEWLSDNGPPYTAWETKAFGAHCGLKVCNTPSYSPESNGMAEAFVKTFKRDYVNVSDVDDARTVMQQLGAWMEDYNEAHPHKGLKMLSPRQFRRLQTG